MYLSAVVKTHSHSVVRPRGNVNSFVGESILICSASEKRQVIQLLSSSLAPATSQLIQRDEDGNLLMRTSVKRALLEVVASGSACSVSSTHLYTVSLPN